MNAGGDIYGGDADGGEDNIYDEVDDINMSIENNGTANNHNADTISEVLKNNNKMHLVEDSDDKLPLNNDDSTPKASINKGKHSVS